MIYIDRKSKTPIYMQIYRCIKNDILSGSYNSGDLCFHSHSSMTALPTVVCLRPDSFRKIWVSVEIR
ncbi:MAG: hypothetical protein ACFWUC_13775 [Oscillospiraceae bacterium]